MSPDCGSAPGGVCPCEGLQVFTELRWRPAPVGNEGHWGCEGCGALDNLLFCVHREALCGCFFNYGHFWPSGLKDLSLKTLFRLSLVYLICLLTKFNSEHTLII